MSYVLYLFFLYIYFIKFKSGKSVYNQRKLNLHSDKEIICVYLRPGKLMCHLCLGRLQLSKVMPFINNGLQTG